jgi:hypothetical protein
MTGFAARDILFQSSFCCLSNSRQTISVIMPSCISSSFFFGSPSNYHGRTISL